MIKIIGRFGNYFSIFMEMNKNIFRIQGAYYFLTGIWPILHLSSFEAVTGPKTDIWLLEMVGLLTVAIGITLFFKSKKNPALLAISSALSYTAIDCIYVFREVISPIYLMDAGVQIVILIALFISGKRK